MTKLIASFVLAASILASVGAAQAGQGYGGEGLKIAAEASTLTPHGTFDR